MDTTTSKDGTAIAYDRFGDGPPLVLVSGAFNNRGMSAGLAAALAADFTAVTYDRRGRGDSGDTLPYAVAREIEDLDAVVRAVGGSAFVHGMSSGAVLALRAAAAGVAITRLSVMEPPFRVPGAAPAPEDYVENLTRMTTTGRPGEAAAYFIVDAVGQPPEAVEQVRRSPIWPELTAMEHTLVYDAHVMGDSEVPTALLRSVPTPTLVLHSTASPDWLRDAAAATAAGLPDARHRGLEGTFHDVAPETLRTALAAFFLDRTPAGDGSGH